uniref:Uncharacterized protein n=1 Tax=Tanacetum cinerariifolium TaxID=118510 RepID=A0A6L2LI06_TANCI|nr:hypothetical protein [Tanacetum cinerariifolium]
MRVKKLEMKQRSRTHKLKRLCKVGLTAKVDSSKDEQSLDDAEMFDVNDLHGEDVFVEKNVADREVTDAGEVNAASIATTDKKRRKHFATKETKENRNKPPTQAQQRKIMCTYLKNMEGKKLKDLKNKSFDSIHKMFDKAFNRLTQESAKKQKVDDDKEIAELKQLMKIILDEEEVAIDAIPLAVKSPRIVDWKIYKEGKKSYYQILRADGKSKMYMFFSQMLQSFDREDLKDLYKLEKARYGSTRPVENMDYLLWHDMKIMFEPHIEDEI